MYLPLLGNFIPVILVILVSVTVACLHNRWDVNSPVHSIKTSVSVFSFLHGPPVSVENSKLLKLKVKMQREEVNLVPTSTLLKNPP